MQLRRVDARSEVEKPILTGMIVSTGYLNRVRKKVKLEYFQLDYVRKIVEWVLEYYDKYLAAPLNHIEDIYTVYAPTLKVEEAELVSKFLESLSEKYETGENFSIDYLEDQTREYFSDRSILLLAEKLEALVNVGKGVEAQQELINYRGVQKELSGWVNIFDPEFITELTEGGFLSPEQDDNDVLFRFPGAVGQLMGPLKRYWLVSILGPRKRGKSFFLQEIALQAIHNRLNVAFISLELDSIGVGGRMIQSLLAMGNESLHKITVFDCLHNQSGLCTKPIRINKYPLMNSEGQLPEWDPKSLYRVCTVCRGIKGIKDYKVEYWFEEIKRPIITHNKVQRMAKGYAKLFGTLMLKSYPMTTTNLTDIKNDINALEQIESFVPDVICIDYADILGPEDSHAGDMSNINKTWQLLKNLAETKYCLVVTATQGNKASGETKNVQANQVSWDVRKNDHVDAQFALSQDPNEKRAGVLRLSNTLHRWQQFDPDRQVYVLQNLALSQVLLDSEYV